MFLESIDLHKMIEWKELIHDELARHEWIDSESEASETDSELDEDEEDDDDDDEEEEGGDDTMDTQWCMNLMVNE